MKRIRALSFAFAALTGAVAGLPVPIHADDTEIYVGNRAFSARVRPNILLILDTSGSMGAKDGLALDRLDRVKVALNAILDEVNDMNIGLARFHTPGGPILFPVSYVDDDAQDVEHGLIPEVNQRVVGSNNDAEEMVVGGAMSLDSPQLEMTLTSSFNGEMMKVFTVETTLSDDAEESIGGVVSLNNTTMNCCLATNGLRFQNVTIPQNAPILSARIEFVVAAPSSVPTSMTFWGEAADDSSTFTNTNPKLTGRAKTTTVTWPGVPDFGNAGDRVQSPNLKAIVQEIVNRGGWASGNDLSILFNGTGDRQIRTFDSSAPGTTDSAQLFVEYGDPATATGKQLIGLRFTDVRVPQKQGIKSAVLEFVPVDDATAAVNLEIHGQASDDSLAFTATAGDISSRPGTLNKVQWTAPAATWKDGVTQVSPDITAIVQEIVNRPGWCGGNAMTFGIDDLGADGPRIAASFDGDPGRAPLLRIDFDTTKTPGPGEGCTIQEITARPSIASDDADQDVGSNTLNSVANVVKMESGERNGLRFQGLGIPKGVTITDARLVFEAANTDIVPVTVNFAAHAVDTAVTFSANAGADVVSRTPVTSSVSWAAPPWTAGDVVTSDNIWSVIDGVVNNVATNWVSGNDLVILMDSVGAGLRHATSYDASPADAPQLRVTMRANIGDLPNIPVTTVRQRLKQVVNGLDHSGTTPIVDNLYEAAAYFRGEAVTWGLNRGTSNDTVRRSTRVSHPASYTGGTVVRDPACTETDLSNQACVTENITGSPNYISPITSECQANFIVLLTDGIANRNSSKSLIQAMTGKSSCSSSLPNPPGGSVSSAEQCGLELTEFLNDPANDQSTSVPGPNTVTTYTIGLNISNDWLKQLAAVGGGQFFQAGSTAQLRKTFNDITSNILQRTTSFATPSLSVNSFNRLFHLDEVYFSLFEPQHRIAWPGNVKKFKVCSDPNICTLGEILDVNGNPAIDANGRILPTAESFWTDPNVAHRPDGSVVVYGGAGNAADVGPPPPRHVNRRVYTFYDLAAPPPSAGIDLKGQQQLIIDTNGDGILDGLTAGTADQQLQQTKTLLGWPGPPVAGLSAADRATLVTELHDQIQWIRGQDVDDEIPNNDTFEDRYSFYDPLHASAVPFTVGRHGVTGDPNVKVAVGTNDGGVRLINGDKGVEEFIFYPQSTLAKLPEVRKNPQGPHHYGIDATPTIWINDIDNDGTLDKSKGDFARVIIGQRRGGNEIYSLEVTPNSESIANDPAIIGGIDPTYNWRIRGGGTEYPRLGQTWSRPKLTTVILANTPNNGDLTPTTVMLFAGGYDELQDAGFGPGGLGNAIYMADPLTGLRLLSVSENDPGIGDRVVVPNDPVRTLQDEPKMAFPIPSDLALMDANSDGNTDRVLVADTGGQVWRLDLAPGDNTPPYGSQISAVLGRLGTVSSGQTLADQRKFFEPPDVVQVRSNPGFSGVPNYDLVTIVSGNRANPLSLTTKDRFFAFRDTFIGPLTDDGVPSGIAGDGIADDFTTLRGALDSPLTAGDLFDVTNIVDPQGTDLANLQNANGYYFDLVDPGEKGLSSPIILGGTVFFTTYLPDNVVNVSACTLVEGSGLLYGVNVLNGTSVFNWDQGPSTDPLSVADRRMQLGSGIPSAAVPIFQPKGISLLIGGSGGATVVDPGLALPRSRTFWFEERGL